MEEGATAAQTWLEEAVAGDGGLHKAAGQAYVSYVRSYASYPKEARDVFCFKVRTLSFFAILDIFDDFTFFAVGAPRRNIPTSKSLIKRVTVTLG